MEMMDVESAAHWLDADRGYMEISRKNLKPFKEVPPEFHRSYAALREQLEDKLPGFLENTNKIVDLIEAQKPLLMVQLENYASLVGAVTGCLGEVHKVQARIKEVIAADCEGLIPPPPEGLSFRITSSLEQHMRSLRSDTTSPP